MAEAARSRPAAPWRRGLPLAFAVAFALGLAAGAAHWLVPGADLPPMTGDSAKYDQLARGVERLIHSPPLLGRLFSGTLTMAERDSLGVDRWELQHAPGYVLPLGLAYALSPDDEGAGRALGLVCYALAAGLLLLIGRRIAGRRSAWVLLGLFLLYPPLVYYALGVATEGHAMASLLLVAWLALLYHRRATRDRALWLGLALANLYLAKTTFRGLALGLLALELWSLAGFYPLRRRARLSRPRASSAGRSGPGKARASARGHRGGLSVLRRRARTLALPLLIGALAPVACALLVMAAARIPLNPLGRTGEDVLWAYRGNYVPDQGWESAGLGDAIGPELAEANRRVVSAPLSDEEGLALRHDIYGIGLRLTIARYPIGWLALVGHKLRLFWTYPSVKTYLHTVTGQWAVPRWMHVLLWPLGLLGAAVACRRRGGLWIPAALALGVAAVHALTHLVARYHIPVLPIWLLYAGLGVKSAGLTFARAYRRLADARRHSASDGAAARLAAPLRELPWRWPLLALAALLAGGLLIDPPLALPAGAGRALYILGSLLRGGAWLALAPFVLALGRFSWPKRRARAAGLPAAAALLALTAAATPLAERDWDAFATTLSQPGEELVQRIGLSPGLRATPLRLRRAQLEIDMLRSPEGSFRLEVIVEGRPIQVFSDTLGGCYEAFLFDPESHDFQARYRRVADTFRRFVTGYLDPRYGARSPGFDYFRRWVKVPLPRELLATDTLEVVLRLAAASGGAWVQVFGDRYNESGRFLGPAVGENPFEHSNYRAEYLAGDRRTMDARLTRPRQRESLWRRSLRRDALGRLEEDLDPGWRDLEGDLRVHLRVALRGALVKRQTQAGEMPTWVEEPGPEDVPYGKQELRRLQWWRDAYFDGTRIL